MSQPLSLPLPHPGRPSSAFVSYDPRFSAVVGDAARLEQVVATDAHEGPVYAADEDALYFTSLPRGRETGFPEVEIKRLALDGDRFPLEPGRISVLRESANAANGMTLDLEGRLVVCEQGTLGEPARISRLDRANGAVETVVEAFKGRPLNSPNDAVVASDGAVWFTDPSYGYLQGFRPEPALGDRVYRYDAGADRISALEHEFDKPNGLAFSPDEQVLYVTDNGAPHHFLAFALADEGRTGTGRIVAVGTPKHPDGLKVDAQGRIYASASTGIQIFAPDGDLIGEIRLPGAVNFTFGGPGGNVLFITRDDSIWAAVLNTKGARP